LHIHEIREALIYDRYEATASWLRMERESGEKLYNGEKVLWRAIACIRYALRATART
jgi:hypothetical protein